nr:MAG TPA: Protein of unknown function (DUF669) [Caudoviricetes sp.]
MAFTFDFTNYRETGSAQVPAGTYRARVNDFEETESKAGNAMFVVYLEILDGPYAGKQIIDRLPQTEKAMFRSAAFLQALGVKIAKKRLALNPNSLIGRPVDILVEDGEPYNGRVKSEVREYLRATKPAAKAKPAADLPDGDDEPAAPSAPAEAAETVEGDPFDVDALDIDDLDL